MEISSEPVRFLHAMFLYFLPDFRLTWLGTSMHTGCFSVSVMNSPLVFESNFCAECFLHTQDNKYQIAQTASLS